MSKKYIVGVVIVIAVLLVNQFVIQYWLSKQTNDANAVNVSGRQRMLSQKINVEFYKVAYQNKSKSELKLLLAEWGASHRALLHGSQLLEVDPVEDTNVIASLLRLEKYLETADSLIQLNEEDFKANIALMNLNQQEFLGEMDLLVKQFEEIAEAKISQLIFIEVALFLLAILVVLLEIQYIYLPIQSKMRKASTLARKTEQTLKAIHHSSSEAVVFTDTNLIVQFGNHVSKNMTKMIFNRELQVGDHILDAVSKKRGIQLKAYYDRVLLGETIRYSSNFDSRFWEHTIFPVTNSQGDILGLSHNAKEITDIIRFRNKLIIQTEQLEQILWCQSHEVREPLTAILGIANLMKETEGYDEKYIEYLVESARKLDLALRAVSKMSQAS